MPPRCCCMGQPLAIRSLYAVRLCWWAGGTVTVMLSSSSESSLWLSSPDTSEFASFLASFGDTTAFVLGLTEGEAEEEAVVSRSRDFLRDDRSLVTSFASPPPPSTSPSLFMGIVCCESSPSSLLLIWGDAKLEDSSSFSGVVVPGGSMSSSSSSASSTSSRRRSLRGRRSLCLDCLCCDS